MDALSHVFQSLAPSQGHWKPGGNVCNSVKCEIDVN